jgi:CRP/FNR family transcriptional regulator, cyclic AMP receptor protein
LVTVFAENYDFYGVITFHNAKKLYIMETINFLKTIDLFGSLDDAEIAAVASRIKAKAMPKNSPVIITGDESSTLYIIKQGRVNVVACNTEGKEIILSTLQAGDIFGELSLFDDKPRSADVVSVENCVFLTLYKPDFLELLDKNPKIALQIIRYLCQRIRFTNSIAQSFALMDVYERLRKLLYDLATPENDGKLVIRKPVSQREMASHIGSGREMISRILSELVKGGYLTIEHKIITIHKKLPKGR